jgi:hypothetical protein
VLLQERGPVAVDEVDDQTLDVGAVVVLKGKAGEDRAEVSSGLG